MIITSHQKYILALKDDSNNMPESCFFHINEQYIITDKYFVQYKVTWYV